MSGSDCHGLTWHKHNVLYNRPLFLFYPYPCRLHLVVCLFSCILYMYWSWIVKVVRVIITVNSCNSHANQGTSLLCCLAAKKKKKDPIIGVLHSLTPCFPSPPSNTHFYVLSSEINKTMNWQVKGSDTHRQSANQTHVNNRAKLEFAGFTDSVLQCHLTKHLRFQLSSEREKQTERECWPLHWINCAQSLTTCLKEKKNKKFTSLHSDEQNNCFEKRGKQCHSSTPAETKKKGGSRRKVEVKRSFWTDACMSDVLPLLTAVRLIVTLHGDISISVWLPEAPRQGDLFTTKK